MEINYLNLKRMFNHVLLNIPEHKIKMNVFRTGKKDIHKCGSSGCVIGHCIILDDWKNITFLGGEIDFYLWSSNFTGIYCQSDLWKWCFSGKWPDNKEQILLRIKYLIDNQSVPEDWDDCDNRKYLLPVQELVPYKI